MQLPLDRTDKKLLAALMKNARLPITSLAKASGVSREVATYRLKRLEEKGIILNYVTEVNVEKLGYVGAAVFVATKTHRESDFRKFLSESRNICWVGEHVGIWDFGMSILGRNNKEIDVYFSEMYNKFKDFIIDHRFTLHKKNYYFYEKLFGEKSVRKQKRSSQYIADELDKKILQILVTNARVDYVELAKKIPLTAPAIKQRIRQLENSGYIERYSVFLDYSKLNAYQYSIFIINKNIDDRQKLLEYLAEHPDVCFICEYTGDPFMEFGVFVDNPYHLRKVIKVIEESFPDNRIMEISLQKEIVSVAPAKCVFD